MGEARELQHSLRSSKLTEALRGALAGAPDTAVVLAVSPSSSHEVESERTLRFGLAAARVRTADEANVEVSPEVAVVQEQIDEQIAVIAEVCVCVCACAWLCVRERERECVCTLAGESWASEPCVAAWALHRGTSVDYG